MDGGYGSLAGKVFEGEQGAKAAGEGLRFRCESFPESCDDGILGCRGIR